MGRDIKHLIADFEDALLLGKASSAAEIQFSLQHRSPFWTGTFNRSWKVQKGSRVAATIPRGEYSGPKVPKKGEAIMTTLSEALYVGNQTDYAAFVINKKRSEADGMMYEELFEEKRKTTPIPNQPDWYDVYLKTALESDLNEGFSQFGFTIRKSYG
jgi:hypothetical protein